MTLYRTADLTGELLDAAVWRACSDRHYRARKESSALYPISPWEDWAIGGAIIEQEKIAIHHERIEDRWAAGVRAETEYQGLIDDGGGPVMCGPTLLIAAMRAYVASKFGETIELP